MVLKQSRFQRLFFVSLLCVCAAAVWTVGCGPAVSEAPVENQSTGQPEKEAPQPGDGMAVEGLTGTLHHYEVDQAFDQITKRLNRCHQKAQDGVLEEISGEVEFIIMVNGDGSVDTAFIRRGNLGSSYAESCMLNVVSSMTFNAPAGGTQARVSKKMEYISGYDEYPVNDWTSTKESKQMSKAYSSDIEGCLKGQSGVQLTVYVLRGGKVVSAGATSDELEAYEAAQCLAKAAKSWKSERDPGNTPAKITFEF